MANYSRYIELFKTVLDTILPPRCVGTGKIVDIQGSISPDFWSELNFIEKPFCKTCGLPFSFDVGEDCLCANCLDTPPEFDKTRAAVVYNDASRKVILAFKFKDKTHYLHTFVPWMMRSGAELIKTADYIIPVPLHNKKLRQRLFNQSALLAQEIARRSGKNYLAEGLIRSRNTTPQKGLSKKERLANISGAFEVNKKFAKELTGKTVLLIDDIFTTGSTLNECAKMLKKAGATEVNILAIARVTKEEFH